MTPCFLNTPTSRNAAFAVEPLAVLFRVERVQHDLVKAAGSRLVFEPAQQLGADAATAVRARDVDGEVGDRGMRAAVREATQRRPADDRVRLRGDEHGIVSVVLAPPRVDFGGRLGLDVQRRDAILDPLVVYAPDRFEIGARARRTVSDRIIAATARRPRGRAARSRRGSPPAASSRAGARTRPRRRP